MSTLARWTSKLPDLPIGPRARKGLRIAGYVLAGLITFVYALHFAFPYDRLKDRGVDALSGKYDVSVGGVERGWLPGDFSLRLVQLRSRPEKPGDQPKVIVIDRLDIDVELLASALKRKAQVSIDAQIGTGRLEGTIVAGKGTLRVDLESRNLPLSDVPGLAGVIGMPMSGPGNVQLSLDLQGNDWRKADARLAIDCANCTVGGEGAFFKPRTNSRTADFVGQGVPVPELQIDSIRAEWLITGGKIVQKAFTFVSPHLQVQLDLAATIEKDLKDARFDDVCLRYRGTDLLKQEHNEFYNALELTGGPLDERDGLRHLKIVGTLEKNRALGKTCGAGGDDDGGDAVGGGRPSGAPPTPRRPDLSNVPAGGGDTKPADPVDNQPTPTNPPDPEPPDTAGGAENPRIEPTPQKDDVGAAQPGEDPGAAAEPSGAPAEPQPPDPAASVTIEPAPPPEDDPTQPAPPPEPPPEVE